MSMEKIKKQMGNNREEEKEGKITVTNNYDVITQNNLTITQSVIETNVIQTVSVLSDGVESCLDARLENSLEDPDVKTSDELPASPIILGDERSSETKSMTIIKNLYQGGSENNSQKGDSIICNPLSDSNDSDATELESGDDEILVHRQTKLDIVTSRPVSTENLETSREEIYKIWETLESGIKIMGEKCESNQGEVLLKCEVLGNDIKIIQNSVDKNNEMVCKFLKNLEFTMNTNLNTGWKKIEMNVKGDMQEVLKETSNIKDNATKFQNEVRNDFVQLTGEMTSLQEGLTTVENNMKKDLNIIEKGMKNEIKTIKSGLKNVREDRSLLQKTIEDKMASNLDKILSQGQGMNDEVRVAVSGVEDCIKAVGETLGNKVEMIEIDVSQLKYNIEEINKKHMEELVLLSEKMEILGEDLHNTKVEIGAQQVNTQIQIGLMESNVHRIDENLKGIEREQTDQESKIMDLTSIIKGLEQQHNEINENFREIKSKGIAVGPGIPELCQTLNLVCQTLQAQRVNNTLESSPYATPLNKVTRSDEHVVPPMNSYIPGINANTPINPIMPIIGANISPTNMNMTAINANIPSRNTGIPFINTDLPSISSSPLAAEGYITPKMLKPLQMQEGVGIVTGIESDCSDKMLVDIMKKEQRPKFSGDNVSPPVFINDVEKYFKLIQANTELRKLQIFGLCLKESPLEWWKLIAEEITSWDEAKKKFLESYFNTYDRKRYKEELKNLKSEDFKSVEEFVLKGFKIINTIKPNDTDKKWERMTVLLPEPLRDFLLDKTFASTQEYINKLKEGMFLKKFNPEQYLAQKGLGTASTSATTARTGVSNNNPIGNTSSGTSQNGGNNQGNGSGDGGTNRNSQNGRTYFGMNPRYRGNPSHYDPNFRQNNGGNGNQNGNRGGNGANNQSNRNGHVTPPRSTSHTSNPSNRGNGSGYRGNNGYRGGNITGRGANHQAAGPSGANTTPRLGVNQVAWTTVPNQDPSSPVPTSPIPSTTPINNFYFSFPAEVLKTFSGAASKALAPTADAYDSNGNYAEDIETTEN